MCRNEDIYNDIMKMHSKNLIAQDGITLSTFLLNIHDSAMNLLLIPFCALYCRSANEFFGVEETEIEKEVKDIRNGLKIFTGKYSRGKKMVTESDAHQNEIFKSMMRFPFTKNNTFLNLGVYFNEKGKVVFDTQLADFYLNISQRDEISLEEKAWKVGNNLGKEISEILIKYYNIIPLKNRKNCFNMVPKYGYIDINTNRKSAFFNKYLDKETNLILLHMLSTIGFVNNLLIPVFPNKNGLNHKFCGITDFEHISSY